MSICYWNQRKRRTPVLEIERLPASAPRMHQMDSSFSLTNLPCSSASLTNSRRSHQSPIRAKAPRRLLPPEYYSDFTDSESDSSSSEEERVNLRLRHRRNACVLPPSVIPAKKNVDRDWRAHMNTCVIPSLTNIPCSSSDSHSDQSLSPDQFPSIEEVSPPPSPSLLSPLSLPSLVSNNDSLSRPPSAESELSPFDSNGGEREFDSNGGAREFDSNGGARESPSPFCLPAPASSPYYSSDFDDESEYSNEEEDDEENEKMIEDVEVDVPSSPPVRSIPSMPTIPKETLTVAQILTSLRRSEVPKIIVHQPEDLPEVAEDLPEVAEDLPEVAEDLPEVAEDLPEVAEDLPEVADDLTEVAEDLPEVAEDLPEESKEDVKAIARSMVNEIFAEVKENLAKDDKVTQEDDVNEDTQEEEKPVQETEYVGSLRRWPFSSFFG